MSDNEKYLDRPLWGAEAIGREAGLLDDAGNVNLRAAFYALEKGIIPAVSALSGMRLLARLIVAPRQGYDEPGTLS
jgi:hypothetical protein